MKLIDKDALVTEIGRLDALYHTSKDLSGDLFIQGLFCFLDTFKVKELDLEEEIEYVRKTHFINDDFEKARKWFEEQNEWRDLDGNRRCDMESFEDFIKYMEGE